MLQLKLEGLRTEDYLMAGAETTQEAAPTEHQRRISMQFDQFHGRYPQVYERLMQIALRRKEDGHRETSFTYIYEQLRDELHREQFSNGLPKPRYNLDNNFRPIYARLIMDEVPQLRGFFPTREPAPKGG